MNNYDRVYAEIDLDAVLYNIEQMKNNISPDTKIMGIIKADGYGHGAVMIGRELEKLDYVFGYGVATAEEALILRAAGIEKPILILGYTFPYCYEELISNDIQPAVFRFDMLKEVADCASRLGKKAKIHIKVDTGMSRIGIYPNDTGLEFIREALSYESIEVEGVFTHFARADETDKTSVKEQIDQFSQFINRIEKEFNYNIPIKHCSNSAGIIELKDANMDVVRAGISLYGLWPSDEVRRDIISLKPVLSLKSHIVYIKQVEKGTPVSYGGTYVAKEDMKIATIPIGYGDGYPRGLSNKGYILIHGKRAPILGRVCMDQFMVSVNNIPEAKEGDEVTLIGQEGKEQLTMEELGDMSGRFNYELACMLSKRIPRVYVKQGEIVSAKDYFEDYI
ncbi:MAG: alanine racemase [Lachnospiraceae bacterium]|nr:alanine racemase [Lachnospiraceae bacterium]